MSKATGKKRSCFQITSVTEGTERPADLDVSLTEYGSSETFEPGVCGRSSPEESFNCVEDHQERQLASTAPVNGGFSYKTTSSGRVTPHNASGSVPTASTVPASVTTPISSCSSRFRVIKLDHGTGEPFRRGRWTCTEYYEKDSDSNRTVDGIKPTLTPDHSMDRDSGLVTISSAVNSNAMDNSSDSGYSTLSYPPECLPHGYSLSPQIGSGASAFQPPGYAAMAAPQPAKQGQVNMPPFTPPTFVPSSLNGMHQQMSPVKPLVTPPQQFAFPSHPTGFPSAHPDYHQQHLSSGGQSLPAASSSLGSSSSQVTPTQFTPTSSGAHSLKGEGGPPQGLILHVSNSQTSMSLPGVGQPQHRDGLGDGVAPNVVTTTSHSSGQHVPVTAPVLPGATPQTPAAGGSIQFQGTAVGLHSGFRNQVEENRQRADAPQHTAAAASPENNNTTGTIGNAFNLPSPAVKSLLAIQISMDDDDDRNPSTAFYQAFQPSRLRRAKPANDSASSASVAAIDNKIEQAMDLVKSHLMYAVREEVEVLKEQIKELYERNSMLERENAVLKSLANTEQLSVLSTQLSGTPSPLQLHQHTLGRNGAHSLVHHEAGQGVPYQPNITSA